MTIVYATRYGGAFEDLRKAQASVAAQEAANPEGTLVLLNLELAEAPRPVTLLELNHQLLSFGVPPWPGYRGVVFTETANPKKVYLCWEKGMAWSGIIFGILLLLLPTIIGGLLWFLIPAPIKEMLEVAALIAIMVPVFGMLAKEK